MPTLSYFAIRMNRESKCKMLLLPFSTTSLELFTNIYNDNYLY
jgi:hypothetical protein